MLLTEKINFKVLIWCLVQYTVLALTLPQMPANERLTGTPVKARSLYEQYTLGQQEEGSKIIYTYQYTQTFDESQAEISLDFHYPDAGEIIDNSGANDNPVKITHIELFVKSQDGGDTQAYVTEGGIGENNISLQIIATKSNLLNYMVVIYGKNDIKKLF